MKIFFLLLFASLSFAQDIKSIVKEALQQNLSLQAVKERIEAAQLSIKRADNLDDPILTVGLNDLRLDDLFDRSLEPMQSHFVTLAQKIPAPNKRKLDKILAMERTKTIQKEFALDKEKVALQLYLNFTTYYEAKKKLAVIDRLLPLVRKNSHYLSSMMLFDSNKHLLLIKNDMLLDKIERKKLLLRQKLFRALRNIEALSLKKIDSIDLELPSFEPKSLRDNKVLHLLVQKTKLQQVKAKRVELDQKSDFIFKAGYYQRAGFHDYVSFSIGLNLPIYGTQKIKYQEEKTKELALQFQTNDLEKQLKARIESLRYDIGKLQEELFILKQKTLRALEHFFSISLAQIRTGKELYGYLDMLEDRYYLELEAIEIESLIFKKKVELAYLTGALL